MTTQGVVVTSSRSNKVNTRRKKTRAKSMNSIDYVGVRLQSIVTYTYIGSRT
jgi:hypothetical protein